MLLHYHNSHSELRKKVRDFMAGGHILENSSPHFFFFYHISSCTKPILCDSSVTLQVLQRKIQKFDNCNKKKTSYKNHSNCPSHASLQSVWQCGLGILQMMLDLAPKLSLPNKNTINQSVQI